jgi:hypothetical protein
VPQVILSRPLHEFDLCNKRRLDHRQSAIFAAVRPAPQRPLFFSGRFANGQALISSGFSFLNNAARAAGVKPLRVRAA